MLLSRAFQALRVSKSCEHTAAGETSVFDRSCESTETHLSIKQQHWGSQQQPHVLPATNKGAVKPEA